MKTPEQQANDVEKANKEVIENTVKIPIKAKTIKILKDLTQEKAQIEQLQASIAKREADIIDILLDMKDLDKANLLGIRLDELTNEVVVTLKPVDNPKEEKPNMKILAEDEKAEKVSEKLLETVEDNHK